MYCQNFIKDFVNKVVEKAVCCDACRTCLKICNGPRNFNYLNPDICKAIVYWKVLSSSYIKICNEVYLDILISCLHNNQCQEFFTFLDPTRSFNVNRKVMIHRSCYNFKTDFRLYSRNNNWTYIGDVTENSDYFEISFQDWFDKFFKG